MGRVTILAEYVAEIFYSINLVSSLSPFGTFDNSLSTTSKFIRLPTCTVAYKVAANGVIVCGWPMLGLS